jgi:hypothetical protein
MKNRHLVLFLSLILGVFALSGCEDVAQVQTPVEFAQVRVANFNNTCDINIPQVYDVYIYPVGEPAALPIVRGLEYGDVSAWSDNLATNREAGLTYKIVVRNSGETERDVISVEQALKPGDRYTLWIFQQQDAATPDFKVISDKPAIEIEQTTDKGLFPFR